jgi:two-component system KDP operon response regulator KdpE
VSVRDESPGRARVALRYGHVSRAKRAGSSRVPARLLAADHWRRIRVFVFVRWEGARLDRELAAGISPHTCEALALRARMITGRRGRASVARGLASVLRSASDNAAAFSAAVRPDRREVLAARTVIDAIERRLVAPEPLTARGIAMLLGLLTDPASPLYRSDEPGALGSRLRAAAAALDAAPARLTVRESSVAAIGPRVLVVAGEPQLVRGLKIMLRAAGYAVNTAPTTVDALAILAEHPPDALVLDLVLPDGGAAELCKEVRRCGKLPILIVSVIGDDREKVRALDAGADEYLDTPFRGEELLARLRRVLQRSAEARGSSTLEIGELVIDLDHRRVICAGAEVPLVPTEFELVRVLAQHHGRLVTDRQLLRAVWGTGYVQQTHYLRVGVAQVRTKLERDPSRPQYLITEPGVGYRLCDPRERLA